MSTYAITGIQEGLAKDKENVVRQVPLRMELDEWCNSTNVLHKNQRALFFQAFNNFCQMDPKEKTSYFQIAGIHGQPFIPWDEDESMKVENKGSGYCTHNSILFTTWHRPYMLLFEQVIYGLMEKVAATFSEAEQADMRQALESWRFPYWDWAMKKPNPRHPSDPDNYNIPIIFPYGGVEIKVPASFKPNPDLPPFPNTGVWNPFYQFTMPKPYTSMGDKTLGDLAIQGKTYKLKDENGVEKEYHYPLDLCKGTTRHATLEPGSDVEEVWIEGRNQNDAVVNALRNIEYDGEVPGNLRASPSDAFYRVVNIPKFEDFATKRFEGMGPDEKDNQKEIVFGSAENLHDWIHGVCGGEDVRPTVGGKNLFLLGHMSNVPVAAFDPIFWVHHCNVDRMVAIWEVLHSGSKDNWFDGTDTRDKDSGNWAIKKNHPDSPKDNLRPFHKGDGTYWTSNDVRETAPLGYTYPQLEKWKYVDDKGEWDVEAHKAALTAYLNQYHNAAAKAAFKALMTADPGEEESSKPTLTQLQLRAPDLTPDRDIIGVDDYIVNVVYNRFALGGRPYTIHVFVGKVPEQLPYTFDDPEGSLVGQVYTFSSPADQLGTDAEKGCGNCRSQEAGKVMSSGTVVLTNALITRWKNQLEHTPRDLPRILADMKPENVVPFLHANLRWRVTSVEGLVPRRMLEDTLRVSVAVGKADHYADQTKLSRFYDYKGASEVTVGRPQGASPEDNLYPPGCEYTCPAQA
ncbi:common central domain of tyrosinase-domain-containing protein [Cercophora samala]|uniref:tyrosinase n=1 Tax=Cercophora samala TaxID=330535 RepID=A0AA40DDV9_9PEZI|nr:common central domain of tyrosinase-domain-containing protein [Cercophora samala]